MQINVRRNWSHVNRSVSSKSSDSAVHRFDHRFWRFRSRSTGVGFRKGTGPETSSVDNPTCWTGWTSGSNPVFKTLVFCKQPSLLFFFRYITNFQNFDFLTCLIFHAMNFLVIKFMLKQNDNNLLEFIK